MDREILFNGLVLFSAAATMWGAHWFPWHKVGSPERLLPRVPSYVLGVSGIVIFYGVWLGAQGEYVARWRALGWLVGVCVAAGVGTVLPRVINAALSYPIRDRELRELYEHVSHAVRPGGDVHG